MGENKVHSVNKPLSQTQPMLNLVNGTGAKLKQVNLKKMTKTILHLEWRYFKGKI